MKRILTLILTVCLCLLPAAPASAVSDSSPFVGNWKFYAQEGSAPMTHEEVLAMAAIGLDMANGMITTIRDDGTLSMNVFGEVVEGTWTDNGDGTGVFCMDGDTCPMTVKDGFLRLDMPSAVGVFEPADTAAEDSTAGFPPLLEEFINQFEQIEMPKQETLESVLVGEWRFYSMESDDPELNIPHEALPNLLEKGLDYAGDYTLTFKDDGWFKFCDFYGFEQNNWSDSDNGPITIFADGDAWECSVEDGLLVLRGPDSVMRYEKLAPIGTTGYHVVIPADYTEGDVTEAQRQDDMIAYYRSDSHLMDFDVYQFAADGRTLKEYAVQEARQYGAKNVENVEINGIPFVLYYSEEQYDDAAYRVANYLFAAGDDFGELAFWLDGEDAKELTKQIVSSIFYREPVPEDVHGVIVEKLEGDYFPDRYLVLGEDGELYEGEYFFGFEDLKPGTEVIVSKSGHDWRIEPEDPWSFF